MLETESDSKKDLQEDLHIILLDGNNNDIINNSNKRHVKNQQSESHKKCKNHEQKQHEEHLINERLNAVRNHEVIKILDIFNSKYNCRICRKKLRYKAEQIIHNELKHKNKNISIKRGEKEGEAKTGIKCPYCFNFITRTYSHLTLHLMIKHLNEKPYGCRVCKKRFYAFINLKKHCIKMHKTQLYDLIDYDNSNIISSFQRQETQEQQMQSSACHQIKEQKRIRREQQESITIESSEGEIDVVGDDFEHLNDSQSGSSTALSLRSNENNMQNTTSTETFTLITKFNYHECSKCLENFKSSCDYLIHYWNKHTDKDMKRFSSKTICCWLCKLTNFNEKSDFKSDAELRKHILIEHLNEEFEYKCSLCNHAVFLDLQEAKEHYTLEHMPKTTTNLNFAYACFNCEQIYFNQENIQNHFLCNSSCQLTCNHKHHKCIHDNLVFKNQKAYQIHLYQHKYLEIMANYSPTKPLNITSPPILYKKTPIFIRPRLNNINNRINNNSFEMPSSFDLDNLGQSTYISFPINIRVTPASSNNLPALTYQNQPGHVENLQNTQTTTMYKCEFCDYNNFRSTHELSEHILKHKSTNPRRPYQCHLCQVTFVKVDHIQRHMIVHRASDLDFTCQICYSTFTRRQDLDRHMLFHAKK
jgi:hypothetical protein